ncbi:PhoH family protein [Fervidobacterium nodosum]|uniref:PhoH-like protein n=1 Tax=Fervidobacterium nodosum (strain ATCC 35602 / DSM 5306 / Rt17-B1) TaxID=381764 RepID=A7HLQ3_FERNB|nr:PhoH family protein [Fervidobacterium nodosum]ABS60836.1 PhoH family protein [Fervidobacterium nodosum Rt17-B1]PHJ13660.1 DEAD/DEAH box helicase [Fervidobacterium sp. SC_NGM5_G05]
MNLRRISIPSDVAVVEILGQYDNKARYLRRRFNVEINVIDDEIRIKGEDEKSVNTVEKILREVINITREGHLLDWTEFEYIVEENEKIEKPEEVYKKSVGKVKAKTEGQRKYLEAIEKNDIVFAIGPAGTGKTYLASAVAVDYLKSGRVQRIVLTRPAVEAGEKLGFLPGDLTEKVDPYLRPLYDALIDMVGIEKFISLREKNVIEIAPLAYMRGRTLNNAFIILDEAQNTTYEQMKMFLTRMGFGSKVIVNGDITQIDIEEQSGLVIAQEILKDIDGIAFVYLTDADVVRHPLVKKIIRAYDSFEKNKKEEKLQKRR